MPFTGFHITVLIRALPHEVQIPTHRVPHGQRQDTPVHVLGECHEAYVVSDSGLERILF